jgi:hypothetical protein
MAHVDIVDRIKAITEGLGWVFTYGQVDVKNLIEASQSAELTPEEIHFLLLPVNRSVESNQYGKATTLNYDLAFSIFTPDQFDSIEEGEGKDYYWQKFNYKVRPLIQALYYFQAHLVCPGIVLNIRRINEVYNDGTENLTGVFAEASASIDLDFDFGKLAPQPPLPPVNVFCELLVQCPAWISLEARVTALEQGGGGGGLTCAELINCEVIQEILGQLQSLAESVQAAAQDAAQALALAGTAVQPGALAEVATSGAYGDLSGTPSIPTLVSQLTNDSGFQTAAQVNADIAAKVITLYDFTPNTADNVTGAKMASVLIPANTIGAAGGVMEIEWFISRTTGGNNQAVLLYINTSDSLSGATQIGRMITGTANLTAKAERTYRLGSDFIRGFDFASTAYIDEQANSGAISEAAVDWSIDQYILVGTNIAAGQPTRNEMLFLKISRQ